MKIGIVGGTGTISTSVVTALLERGHDVTCITRGLSGDVPDGARVLVGDRNDLDWFIPAVRAASFEAGIDFISYQPEQARASLEAFRGVGRFVHTSTVATIGDDFDWLPATEEHPLRPTHPYGVNKLLIDRMYQAAYFAEDFPVTILKPSTTYGQNNVIRQIGWDTTWWIASGEGCRSSRSARVTSCTTSSMPRMPHSATPVCSSTTTASVRPITSSTRCTRRGTRSIAPPCDCSAVRWNRYLSPQARSRLSIPNGSCSSRESSPAISSSPRPSCSGTSRSIAPPCRWNRDTHERSRHSIVGTGLSHPPWAGGRTESSMSRARP